MEELRDEAGTGDAPVVISGCIGPQDDGYSPAQTMSADAARDYHSTQIGTFADTAADMVAASMTYPDEAIGVARAAQDAGLHRRSRSPSRPTGGCPTARRWATRSRRSTAPERRPPTT